MRAHHSILFAVALSGLLLLAGCGSDNGDGTSSAAVTTTATETTTVDQGGGEDGAPPPADREVTELTGFSSPSGNIGCMIDRESVRCDIGERNWEPPPAPSDCKLDYGQGVSMNAGGAPGFVCAGDTALGGGEQLPYGQSIAAGLLRCESEKSGITCRDIESGRGFSLSRERYELF